MEVSRRSFRLSSCLKRWISDHRPRNFCFWLYSALTAPARRGKELIVSKFRQLGRCRTSLVAHQQRRRDLPVAVVGGMHVDHELAKRALHAGEPALEHDERAPESFAAVSKSMKPSASPSSKCCFGWKHNCAWRRSGDARHCRAHPCRPAPRHSANSDAASVALSSAENFFSSASIAGIAALRRRPRPSAFAPPPRPRSSSRRRSPSRPRCGAPAGFSAFWTSPRRFSSSAISVAGIADSPRRASARSKAGGVRDSFDVVHGGRSREELARRARAIW